jgi:hypothetical protein
MTLKEAIESGKRFRRNGMNTWYSNGFPLAYSVEDILTDDWEIEQPAQKKVTMWQAVYINDFGYALSANLFKNEEVAKTMFVKFIKLVNPIEIEVSE